MTASTRATTAHREKLSPAESEIRNNGVTERKMIWTKHLHGNLKCKIASFSC